MKIVWQIIHYLPARFPLTACYLLLCILGVYLYLSFLSYISTFAAHALGLLAAWLALGVLIALLIGGVVAAIDLVLWDGKRGLKDGNQFYIVFWVLLLVGLSLMGLQSWISSKKTSEKVYSSQVR